jgi:hypothetical protein
MPPQETIATYPRREPFEAIAGHKLMRTNAPVKAGTAIRRGAISGLTDDGYLRERKRSLAAGTGFADNSPTGQITNGDGVRFEAGDTLKNEAGEAIGEIQGIDSTTNPDTITLTGNAAVNVAAGEAVLADDGSEVAACIAEDAVQSSEAKDTNCSVVIGGPVKESLLIGLDDSAKADLNGKSFPNDIFKF